MTSCNGSLLKRFASAISGGHQMSPSVLLAAPLLNFENRRPTLQSGSGPDPVGLDVARRSDRGFRLDLVVVHGEEPGHHRDKFGA